MFASPMSPFSFHYWYYCWHRIKKLLILTVTWSIDTTYHSAVLIFRRLWGIFVTSWDISVTIQSFHTVGLFFYFLWSESAIIALITFTKYGPFGRINWPILIISHFKIKCWMTGQFLALIYARICTNCDFFSCSLLFTLFPACRIYLFICNISYMLWLSVANKDVYIIYCLLFTFYSALTVTSLPPRGATVHALNRKSVKNEFPVPLYWVSLM